MDRLMRALPRPSQSRLRDLLVLGGILAVVIGVGAKFGIEWAVILAGAIAILAGVAWSVISVAESRTKVEGEQ